MNRMRVAAALTVAAFASITFGDIINVPGDYPTIQAAIDAAQDGDETVVAPGVYDTESIVFMGKQIVVRSSDGPAVTTIARPPGVGGKVVLMTGGEGPDAAPQVRP